MTYMQIRSAQIIKNKENAIPLGYMLESLCGQRPHMVKAKKSISSFSMKEGMPTGWSVHLKNDTTLATIYQPLVVPLKKAKIKHKKQRFVQQGQISCYRTISDWVTHRFMGFKCDTGLVVNWQPKKNNTPWQ